MIGLATSQSAESSLGTYIGHYNEKRTAIELSNTEKERPALMAEDIYRMVEQDESERMFVGDDEALYEVGGGEKESGFIKFEDIQNIIDKGEKSPIVGHTHPISVYNNVGYTDAELEQMKGENGLPAPMPSSLTDIMGSVDAMEHFDNQNVTIRDRVYDPTGVWEYKIDGNNLAVKLFLEFRQNFNKTIEASMTSVDEQVMEKSGLDLDRVHPLKRISVLKSNKDTRSLGEKLEKAGDEYFDNLSEETQKILEKFAELEVSCGDLARSKKIGLNQEEIRSLIDKYIEDSLAVGIQVTYVPRT